MRLSLETILLGGAAGFLLFTDKGKGIVSTIWPENPFVPGLGDAGGVDPVTGQVLVPTRPQFRIVNVALPNQGFYVDNAQNVFEVTVAHRGPAGRYAVGVDVAVSNPLCFTGLAHGQPFQTFESNVQVGDDGVWADYVLHVAGVAQAGLGVADVRVYVRGPAGEKLAELWLCQSLWTVGV